MKWLLSVVLMALLASTVSAVCYADGNVVPCDSATVVSLIGAGIVAFFAGLGALIFVVVILVIAAFVFWIWMLIDCAQREFDDRVIWIILLVFFHWIAAVLYYFIVKRPDVKKRSVKAEQSKLRLKK